MDLKRVKNGELRLTDNEEITAVLGAYSERIMEALCSDIPVALEVWKTMADLNTASRNGRRSFVLNIESDFSVLLSYLRPFAEGTDQALKAIAEGTAETYDPDSIITRQRLGEVAAGMLLIIDREVTISSWANKLEHLDSGQI